MSYLVWFLFFARFATKVNAMGSAYGMVGKITGIEPLLNEKNSLRWKLSGEKQLLEKKSSRFYVCLLSPTGLNYSRNVARQTFLKRKHSTFAYLRSSNNTSSGWKFFFRSSLFSLVVVAFLGVSTFSACLFFFCHFYLVFILAHFSGFSFRCIFLLSLTLIFRDSEWMYRIRCIYERSIFFYIYIFIFLLISYSLVWVCICQFTWYRM